MLNFQQLHQRLVLLLLECVRNGRFTERGIARITGVSQPHMHHVLKGKRLLSPATADRILHALHLDILDLLDRSDLLEWERRR